MSIHVRVSPFQQFLLIYFLFLFRFRLCPRVISPVTTSLFTIIDSLLGIFLLSTRIRLYLIYLRSADATFLTKRQPHQHMSEDHTECAHDQEDNSIGLASLAVYGRAAIGLGQEHDVHKANSITDGHAQSHQDASQLVE